MHNGIGDLESGGFLVGQVQSLMLLISRALWRGVRGGARHELYAAQSSLWRGGAARPYRCPGGWNSIRWGQGKTAPGGVAVSAMADPSFCSVQR